MSIYWLLFFSSSILALLETSILKNLYVKITVIFSFIIIIGLRHEIGGDWNNYLETFNKIKFNYILYYNFRGDVGYNIIELISNKLNLGIYGVNIICALIVLFSINLICTITREYWFNFIFFIPYFLFIVSMGYTRQSVAIAFSIIGLYYLLNGNNKYFQNYLYYGFYIFLALLFHKSSIIMLLFIIPFINVYFIFLGIIILILTFNILTGFFSSEISRVIEQYININYTSNGIILRNVLLMPSIIIYFLSLIYVNYTKNENKIFSIYAVLVLLFILISLYSPLAIIDRFALYFTPITSLIYVRFLKVFNDNYLEKLIYKIFFVIFLMLQLFIWLNYSVHKSYWVPYKNILF
ncbi:EpsG family protein [Pelagibacteraceae bacterium]|nr:EpsG family protein [Pelagibacteraceae bacterium]